MKDIIVITLTVGLAVGCLLFLAFISGEKSKEREIIDRAKNINKVCYTNEDIEIIIFNKSQL